MPLVKMSRYHLSEKAEAFSANMPSVKLKKDSALNDSGTITSSGASRNTKIAKHRTRNA